MLYLGPVCGGYAGTAAMCELFAMSSRMPTSVGFSLELLARRGGDEGPHRDGWGVAYYSGSDALLLREPGAASESELVRHIEQHGPPSELVISHIRLATQGKRALQNTQPFMRELGGRMHVFAHNGELDGIRQRSAAGAARFQPVGDTDSERAFCSLLDRMAPMWDGMGEELPGADARLDRVAGFAAELRGFGIANFLYADGDILFVHAHHRIMSDGAEVLPGLYVLERSCEEAVPDMSGSGVMLNAMQQALTLVASVPLTDEPWRRLAVGEVLAVKRGDILGRRPGDLHVA